MSTPTPFTNEPVLSRWPLPWTAEKGHMSADIRAANGIMVGYGYHPPLAEFIVNAVNKQGTEK